MSLYHRHALRLLNTPMWPTKACNSSCQNYFSRFPQFIAVYSPNCWKLYTFPPLHLTGIQGQGWRQGLPFKGETQQAISNKLDFDWRDRIKACMRHIRLSGSARLAWERIFQFYSPKMTNAKTIKTWHADQNPGLPSAAALQICSAELLQLKHSVWSGSSQAFSTDNSDLELMLFSSSKRPNLMTLHNKLPSPKFYLRWREESRLLCVFLCLIGGYSCSFACCLKTYIYFTRRHLFNCSLFGRAG